MRYYLAAIFFISINMCYSQTKLDTMIIKLKSQDYSEVLRAKEDIINFQNEAIPKLIELLKDTSFVKLQNTADLIYPGAEKFYGHGWIVNHDIDWISVRAAWLLEEITFKDFGYIDTKINEEKLMKFHQQNYTTYLETGSHKIDFKDQTPQKQLIIFRLMLADSVTSGGIRKRTSGQDLKHSKKHFQVLIKSDNVRLWNI